MLVLAVGLSMDAFAVSICKGLAFEKVKISDAAIVGAWFGGFQALMPLLGWLLGIGFAGYVEKIGYWIAAALLAIIGINMIVEAVRGGDEAEDASLGFKTMILMAIATSIDALVVGIGFAFVSTNIIPAICFIGLITFSLSAAGVKLGSIFGARYKSKAELAGGIILILLGIKMVLEHLGII